LYRLFGESDDVAVMANSVFLAILLLSAYGIGKEVHSKKVGLLSAFLVSTTPLLFNLSRVPYPDYPLAAMVAVAINWLVRVDGFRHRGYSLLLGVTLGLGMLTKQPFIVFVGAPLAYVVAKSGAIRDIKNGLQKRRDSRWRLAYLRDSPLVHILVSSIIALLWYIPNRDYVGIFYLGNKLFFCYWLLLSVTFYILSRRPSQGANLLSATSLGITIASVWYLPRIVSFRLVLDAGYSGQSIEGAGFSFLELGAYTRYLSSMIVEQLGPIYFAALVLAIVVLGYLSFSRGRRPWSHTWMSDEGWIMALWLVIPYLIFTLSLTEHSRYLAPLLPAAAIITGVGLSRIRNRTVSGVLMSSLVLVGTIQYFALSFDSLEWVREMAVMEVPIIGEVNFLADGPFIQLPDSGSTDREYFIVGDLIETIHGDMVADGKSEVRVALLMRAAYLNDVTFSYLTRARGYSGIKLSSKLKERRTEPLYERVFASDYVVLWDTSREPPTDLGRLSLTILRETPSFFREVFILLEECAVPNGDVIQLYKKRYLLNSGYDEDAYTRLGERIEDLSEPGDGIILDPYEQIEVLGRYYSGQAQPYSLVGETLLDEIRMARDLEEITSGNQRLFAVFWPEGQSDSGYFAEQWLNEHHYRAVDEWYDGIALILYETSQREGRLGASRSIWATLGQNISLLEVDVIDGQVKPGGIIRISLRWQAGEGIAGNYRVFLQLESAEKKIVAQRDSEPVGGSRPTTSWQEGETIIDNHGILVPQDRPTGTYELLGGMYLPATGQRLLITDANGQIVGDQIVLGAVQIEG